MADDQQETHWLYTALKKVEFLEFCSFGEIEELIRGLTKKRFPKGETIVREGDPGDYLFLLASGEVSIRAKTGLLSSREIVRLGPGDYFGEMALVTREPRSATVASTQDCEAFLLFSTDFRKILDKNADLARRVDEHIARRRSDRELELRRRGSAGGLWGRLRSLFGR
jgi:CRP-like cAMP-binding protein